LIISSIVPTRQNHSFSVILLIVQSQEQLLGGVVRMLTDSVCCVYRILVFLLASPETLTNFSSIWRWRWRRRAEIIIGAGSADYSRTMRAAGPINGFLNDHCPGEYPVYIRREEPSPPPLLLLLLLLLPKHLQKSPIISPRLLSHPTDLSVVPEAKMKFAVAR